MNNSRQPTPLSYDDILQAALVTPDYQLPPAVQKLSDDQRAELLRDPLTPVSLRHSVYHAQRELLDSLNQLSHSHHLRIYCRGLHALSPEAWTFVVKAGKPNYIKVPAAIKAGTITDTDGQAVADLHKHWVNLQRYAGRSGRQSHPYIQDNISTTRLMESLNRTDQE